MIAWLIGCVVVLVCSYVSFILGAAWSGHFAQQKHVMMLNRLQREIKHNKTLEQEFMDEIMNKD
jgi:hypothetical protein